MSYEHLVHVVREGNLLPLPNEVTHKAWKRHLEGIQADKNSTRILAATTALSSALLLMAFLKK